MPVIKSLLKLLAHQAVELGLGDVGAQAAVGIVLAMVPLAEPCDPGFYLLAQPLGAGPPPGVFDPVEGIEGFPPALLGDQPGGPLLLNRLRLQSSRS